MGFVVRRVVSGDRIAEKPAAEASVNADRSTYLRRESLAVAEIPRDVLRHVESGIYRSFYTNEYKGRYKFPLEFYTNFVSILNGLWDITAYLSDID